MVAPQGLDELQEWVTTSLQGVRPNRHAALDTRPPQEGTQQATPGILPPRGDALQAAPGLLPPEEEVQAAPVQTSLGQSKPRSVQTAASAADDLLPSATHAGCAEKQSGSSGSHLEADGPQSQQPLTYGGDSWPEWRYDGSGAEGFSSLVSPGQLGLLYLVRPQRELREVELRWFLPYGSMKDARCGGVRGRGGLCIGSFPMGVCGMPGGV